MGKTFVTVRLTERARLRGHQVFAFKPIESGCQPPLGDDQRCLVEAAGCWQTGELGGVYQLALPAAPLVAATAALTAIDLGRITQAFRVGCARASYVLVEGAGGWRVPITSDVDMGGLAKALELPVLLVARATLGTINHALLSVEAILRDGCELAGVVLSQKPDDDTTLIDSNIEQIARRVSVPVVALDRDSRILDRFTWNT